MKATYFDSHVYNPLHLVTQTQIREATAQCSLIIVRLDCLPRKSTERACHSSDQISWIQNILLSWIRTHELCLLHFYNLYLVKHVKCRNIKLKCWKIPGWFCGDKRKVNTATEHILTFWCHITPHQHLGQLPTRQRQELSLRCCKIHHEN